jgi:hypothetical protein
MSVSRDLELELAAVLDAATQPFSVRRLNQPPAWNHELYPCSTVKLQEHRLVGVPAMGRCCGCLSSCFVSYHRTKSLNHFIYQNSIVRFPGYVGWANPISSKPKSGSAVGGFKLAVYGRLFVHAWDNHKSINCLPQRSPDWCEQISRSRASGQSHSFLSLVHSLSSTHETIPIRRDCIIQFIWIPGRYERGCRVNQGGVALYSRQFSGPGSLPTSGQWPNYTPPHNNGGSSRRHPHAPSVRLC